MKAYTDYPFEGNETSAVVEVKVLSYDRNKYSKVEYCGNEHEVKSGYLFVDHDLKKRPSKSALWALPLSADDHPPSRGKLSRELKCDRKIKMDYEVLVNGGRRRFASLKAAAFFAKGKMRGHYCSSNLVLVMQQKSGTRYISMPLFEVSPDGLVIFVDSKQRAVFKRAHVEKFFGKPGK